MLKIYGSMLCRDCVDCRADLDREQVPYIFLDFGDNLLYLKEFLKLRDTHPVFSEIRGGESIGIPCLAEENGEVFLDWSRYVSQDKA